MHLDFDLQRFTGTSYADLPAEAQKLLDRFRDFRIAFENINEERYLRKGSSSILTPEERAQIAAVSSLANDVNGLSSALSMISGGFSGDLTQISTEIVSLQNDVETLDAALANKVDTSTFNTALAAKADASALANKVNNATFATLQTAVTNLQGDLNDLDSIVDGKVDKDGSKVLSTNDFTDAYKNKLDGLSAYTFGEGFAMSGTTVNCTVQGAAVLDTVELTVEGGMWLVV